MEGLLILAGLVFGVACLILDRARHQDSSSGGSVEDIGSGRMVDSGSVLPVIQGDLDRFDVAGSSLGLDHEPWPLDRYHEVRGPFDDFDGGARDAAWSSDPLALGDPGHAVGNGMVDDFPVHRICINPATGLPMIADSEVGFDVGGNPYGFSNDDLSVHHDSFGSGFGSDSFDHLGPDTDWT